MKVALSCGVAHSLGNYLRNCAARLALRRISKTEVTARRHVRFGSKADMCGALAQVCSTLESDIRCDMVECPPRAKSGHPAMRIMQKSWTENFLSKVHR